MKQVDHAIDTAMGSDKNLVDCLDMLEDLPQNTSSRLTTICAQSAYLRGHAEMVLGAKASETEILELLDHATRIDHLLTSWVLSVPENWKYIATDRFELPKSATKADFVYQDRIDVYLDPFVAGIWNTYRATRIKVLYIICDCIAVLPQPHIGWLEVRISDNSPYLFRQSNFHDSLHWSNSYIRRGACIAGTVIESTLD